MCTDDDGGSGGARRTLLAAGLSHRSGEDDAAAIDDGTAAESPGDAGRSAAPVHPGLLRRVGVGDGSGCSVLNATGPACACDGLATSQETS